MLVWVLENLSACISKLIWLYNCSFKCKLMSIAKRKSVRSDAQQASRIAGASLMRETRWLVFFRIAYSGSCSLYMPLALFCKQVWNGTGLSRAAKHEHSRNGTVLLANRATSRWASYIAVTFLRCPRIDINSSAVSSVSRTSRCLWLFKNVFSCLVPEIVSVSLQAMRVRRGRFRMYGVRMLQDLRWRGWPESRR